jgi:hypothetical protein
VKVTRQAMMMTGAALAFGPGAVPAVAHDLGRACLSSDEAGTVAARVLGERLAERVGHALPTQHCDSRMIVALDEQVQKLLPAGVTVPPTPAAQGEGFSIRMLGTRAHPVLVLSAAQKRGLVYAAGWLLRSADARGRLSVRPSFSTTPRYSVRMTQIGYRAKNNTYDAWDLKRFRRRIEDFALWGSSGVQVISPSPTMRPAARCFRRLRSKRWRGSAPSPMSWVDFALYYPNLGDYAAPPARQAEADRLSALLKQLPKVDALYIPGGDPGHTPPDHLIPLVEREAAALHAINPAAKVWLSAQGFDARDSAAFYQALAQHPSGLTGVFTAPRRATRWPFSAPACPATCRCCSIPTSAMRCMRSSRSRAGPRLRADRGARTHRPAPA